MRQRRNEFGVPTWEAALHTPTADVIRLARARTEAFELIRTAYYRARARRLDGLTEVQAAWRAYRESCLSPEGRTGERRNEIREQARQVDWAAVLTALSLDEAVGMPQPLPGSHRSRVASVS